MRIWLTWVAAREERLTRPEDSAFSHRPSTAANCASYRAFRVALPLMWRRALEDRIMVQNIRQKGAAVVAVAGLGALLVGCGSSNFPNTQAFAGAANNVPMSIACEPNQRAVVRQVVVNGTPQAQAECVSVNGAAAAYGGVNPVAYAPAPSAQPVTYVPAGYNGYAQAPIPETQFVRTAYPAPAPVVTRTVAPQRVAYQPARERVVVRQPKRSVKKSAVIIGSSAGAGAGIGALIGGKKGAGIGALVGGGGAALWDQITRRK
jgi:hypothetical protein